MTPSEVPHGLIVVDTTVVSEMHARKGRHAEWADLLRGHPLALAFATVGELRAWPEANGWGVKKRADLDLTIRGYQVIPATERVASTYGQVHALFGRKIGSQNDMWIVASAIATSPPLPIATANRADFERMAKVFGFVVVHPDVALP